VTVRIYTPPPEQQTANSIKTLCSLTRTGSQLRVLDALHHRARDPGQRGVAVYEVSDFLGGALEGAQEVALAWDWEWDWGRVGRGRHGEYGHCCNTGEAHRVLWDGVCGVGLTT
jgi:hypothetical protein